MNYLVLVFVAKFNIGNYEFLEYLDKHDRFKKLLYLMHRGFQFFPNEHV